MNKKEANDLTNEMLMTDALLRIKAMESILISKGVFTSEELSEEINAIAQQIAKSILEKAKIPGDIGELLKSLQLGGKKVIDN